MATKQMIIFLSGQQGSGKSTLCRSIMKVTECLGISASREYFAEPLYDFQDQMISWAGNILGADNVPGYFKTIEHREGDRYKNGAFLQKCGDLVRETFGEDILIQQLEVRIKDLLHGSPYSGLVIVEDGRLPDEFTRMQSLAEICGAKFISIRLECPEEVRKGRLGANWRPATGHKTEIGLGSPYWLEKFDYVFHTMERTPYEMTEAIRKDLVEHFGNYAVQEQFKRAAESFTAHFRYLEAQTGHGANFKWSYDKEGKKILEVSDIAPVRKPSAEMVAQARAEVPGILARAEEEISKL